MLSLHQFSLSALTVVAAASLLSSPASAHPQKQRHGHEKQKVYNRGFQKGYNKAIKQVRQPYDVPQKVYNRNFRRVVKDAYRPYYVPQRTYYQRPVVVAPAPWRAPRPLILNPYVQGTRVNVGFGFNVH
jgi:hypothetical protein